MKIIAEDSSLLGRLERDEELKRLDLDTLVEHYESISLAFHRHFRYNPDGHHGNALYHKIRYLALLRRPWTGRILDLGNDKPFLSFLLRKLHPECIFDTISNEIPETPYRLYEVDIEREPFPFESGVFDQIIFTEVIEHLWRNPSHCAFEMNRVLKSGGTAYVTTPNPCDRHALVCLLWQANPNQRSGYFSSLESGHVHLWTAAHLKLLFECHGFSATSLTTENLYGQTKEDETVERFITAVSPHVALMNETVVLTARKEREIPGPGYPVEIFPDAKPVQFQGAITGFVDQALSLRNTGGAQSDGI